MSDQEDPKTIFWKALDISDLEKRDSFIADACASNAALRAEVESLLKAHLEAETSFMDPATGFRWQEEDASVPSIETLSADFPELEILELLGRGGMGAVFKARQASLDRFVALKVLPDAWSSSGSFRERFEREAKTLASLNHPNIVTIHDFGERNGRFFFTMEYVDGTDLAHMIRGQELEPDLALELIPSICVAMQYAHDHHVVHRDIKPGNILVGRDGRVKVADFGLAKLGTMQIEPQPPGTGPHPGIRHPALTDPRGILGTPLYMAPEQAREGGEIDHRADLYALGVVFYEMLVGSPPADGGLTIPPSKKDGIDRRWDRVILRALERDPDRRYQNATEIKTAVESVLAERHWLPRWVKTAGIAALCAALATTLFFLIRDDSPPDESLTNTLEMQFVPVTGVEGLVSVWETRVRDYRIFAEETGRGWPEPVFVQTPDHPAVNVSWHDARAFCQWLTEREHAGGELPPGEVYRLPTDREWSAMAGLSEEEGATPAERNNAQQTIFPWGEEAPVPDGAGNYPDATAREQMASDAVTGYDDGIAATAQVGQFRATPEGLHDLGGNVWEWTSTPVSSDDARPALRGGGWWALRADDGWKTLLASHRRADVEANVNDQWDVGFRVIRGPAPSGPGEPDLFHLVLNGDLEGVRKALADGAEADTSNQAGQPAIVIAADAGDLAMVQLLHEQGARISASDRKGRNPLHAAVELGDTEMTVWLLEHGADPRARTINREEPMHLAMERAPRELLDELLIAAGSEALLEADAAGSAPFVHACINEAPDTTLLWLIENLSESQLHSLPAGILADWLAQLVSRDASLTSALLAKANIGMSESPLQSSLLLAIQLNRESHFTMLRAADQEKELSSPSLKFLGQAAAVTGRPWALKKLLTMGWDLSVPESGDGRSILHTASGGNKVRVKEGLLELFESDLGVGPESSRLGRMMLGLLAGMPPPETRETIRILVEAGADLEARSGTEATPLISAAMQGNLEAVQTLLELGANIEAKDDLGFTPLLSAVEKGHLEVVKELVRSGADFGATTKHGSGPLHVASRNETMVAYLLQKNLPLEIRDSIGRTPLFLTVGIASPDCALLLLEAGAEIEAIAGAANGGSTPLITACTLPDVDELKARHETGQQLGKTKTNLLPPGDRGDRLRCVEMLLEKGADTGAATSKDWTALHVAANSGFSEAVEALLEEPGVNLDAITKELGTPLYLAVGSGHLGCARLLIEHGAVADSPLFPIPLVNSAVQSGNPELLDYLVAVDTPIDLRDAYGALPIHHAGYSGNPGMIRILVDAGADLGATDRFYQTPLHMAAMAGHRDAVDLIVELGGDPTARNLSSETPAGVAAGGGHSALAAHLKSLEKR